MECSSVFIVIEMKDNDKLLKATKEWDKEYNLDRHHSVENLIGEADKDVITEDNKYRIIVWRGIKWYAKISDDKCFKNQEFFESLNDYDIKCDFVRIGEETSCYDVKEDLRSGVVYALFNYIPVPMILG